jgi:carbamoyltransferase
MGMKTHQDEYKVMGMAPYATENPETYRILNALHRVAGLRFVSTLDEHMFQYFLEKNLSQHRFDGIAHAIQKVTEEKLSQWTANAVQETGIDTIACAGGIFMNVKANKVLSELSSVKNLYVMPSASDETTAIGAAYLGYVKHCQENNFPIRTKQLKNMYLGNAYTNKEVSAYIKKKKIDKKYTVTQVKNPEKEIAKLLANGNVVARFSGKMEFGQRALGNRSLLADPSNKEVVRVLNDQIKSRDFWMPFACSILDEDEDKYIINPKRLEAYYMALSFDTKEEHRKDIIAAIHPYDYTVRPQIVTEQMNKRYYELIREFKDITGRGAILNTSLNIHGEPIVCSLEDVFHTFEDSGLEYLMVENHLVQKP